MSTKPRLALAIIAKDEVSEVDRILSKYGHLFDEYHIAADQKLDEFNQLKNKFPLLHIYPYTWINDFSHKRNFLADHIPCEYYFRMDCDDEILNPENVRASFDKMVSSDVNLVYSFYEYAHDIDGNIIAGHYRETIIKNEPNLYWNKKIHENILVRDTSRHKFVLDKSFRIKHNKTEEAVAQSAIRNIEYLIDEFKKDGENTDPRTLAYLGRNLFSIGEIDKAMHFLVKHIQKSGWDEDRYMSRCMLAECHIKKEEFEEAKLCAMEASLEIPSYPDAYLKLHEIFFEQKQWKKAIYWGEIGIKTPPPQDSVMLYDPSSYTWRPAITLAYSYFEICEYEKALSLFKYAEKLAPSCDFIKHNRNMFYEAVQHKNFAEHFIYLAKYIKEKAPEKLASLFGCLPKDMDNNVYIQNARNKLLPIKVWDKDTIVIYCGPVLDEWADPSVKTGIGGSEEAVIYLSREFAKLGKKVYVYNGCGEMEGEYNGVTYLNFQRFNPRDKFDTLISWRVSIFGFPIVANQKWVWFHDVLPTKSVPESHIKNVDKFVVLSKFHKTLLPSYVPEDKILVSSNGINLEDFKDTGITREFGRVIYASSYDRGLEHLLTIWPKVRSSIPKAELYIYYGWNNIDKLIKQGDYRLLEFKNKMLKLLDQPGVHEMGRIGHLELIKEYQRSTIYAYPCSYEEISCISAMKAQACGCYAVTTDFAALDETVQSGHKVSGKGGDNNEEYCKALIHALLTDTPPIDYTPPTWSNVAASWAAIIDSSIKEEFSSRLAWIQSKCKPSDKIVDIGGNKGHTFYGWNRDNVTTVDIDLYDIPNFVRADAANLPFTDKQFDKAVLAEILEHVPDPIACLKEAVRVSKSVIITVPYEHEWEEEMIPFDTVETNEARSGKTRLELAKEGNPTCKEFYMEDNLRHLWHSRHYTEDMLREHLSLAGISNYTLNKLVTEGWVFWGIVID